jgi:sulfide:quinone oxidoreductase
MKLVILGGGSAGTMVANKMRRRFSKDELEIIVIERSETHMYQPGYTLLCFDLVEPEDLMRPTRDQFLDGINLIIDEAIKVDSANNKVETKDHGSISYDYLVVASGCKLVYEEPEGAQEAVKKGGDLFVFYTFDGALKMRDALKEIDGGTIVSLITDLPIKCPAAPIKFIAMAEDMMRRAGKRDKFRFIITSPMPKCFSREPYASKLSKMFEDREIEVVANYVPAEIDHEKKIIRGYDGRELRYNLCSFTPSHEGEQVVQDSEGIGDATGYVTADKHFMNSKHIANIFTIGDASDFPTSKTASGARKQAVILANRLSALMKGKPMSDKDSYDGEIICPILTRDKRVMFAHFNYTDSISPAQESYLNWVIKVYMLRGIYFNLMMPGLM